MTTRAPKVPTTFKFIAKHLRVLPQHVQPLWALGWTLVAYKGTSYTLSEILDIEDFDASTLPCPIPMGLVDQATRMIEAGNV